MKSLSSKQWLLMFLVVILTACGPIPPPANQTITSESETTYASTKFFSITERAGVMRLVDHGAGVVCWMPMVDASTTPSSFTIQSIDCLPLSETHLEIVEP